MNSQSNFSQFLNRSRQTAAIVTLLILLCAKHLSSKPSAVCEAAVRPSAAETVDRLMARGTEDVLPGNEELICEYHQHIILSLSHLNY